MDKDHENKEHENTESDNTEENLNLSSEDQKNDADTENSENENNNESESLKDHVKLLKDQLLRAVAESENIRKRSEKQIEDTAKYAIFNFASDLINVIENLQRATENITKESLEEHPFIKTISEGVEMTKRELFNICEKNGMSRIAPSRGDQFDPNFHKAVAQVEDEELPTGSIVSLMQAGYTLKGRLLREAIVTVKK